MQQSNTPAPRRAGTAEQSKARALAEARRAIAAISDEESLQLIAGLTRSMVSRSRRARRRA